MACIDPQTEADRSCQRCIISSLRQKFPKVHIFGEEVILQYLLISQLYLRIISNLLSHCFLHSPADVTMVLSALVSSLAIFVCHISRLL